MRWIGILALTSMGGVGLVVGLRLLWLAARNGQVPERAIGLAFLFITVLGAPVAATGRLPALVATAPGDWLFGAGLGFALIGIALTWVFTWRVFRPRARWAPLLVGAVGAVCALLWIGLMLASRNGRTLDEILPHTRPWAVGVVATLSLGFLWSGAESLAHHARLRRRLALGLADPVVVDRFLLWSLAGLSSCAMCSVLAAAMLAGHAPLRDPLPLCIISVAAALSSVAWTLTFFPPDSYLRHVRRRAARGEAERSSGS